MKIRDDKGISLIVILIVFVIILLIIFLRLRVINSKDTKKNESGETSNNLLIIEEETTPPIPEGYYYVGGTKDTGFVISDNIEDMDATNYTAQDNLKGNQWVWIPVNDIDSIIEKRKSENNYYEPGMVVGSDGTAFDYREYALAGFNSFEEMENEIMNNYQTMLESIRKYKGFYIGRYELSENGVKKGSTLTQKFWYELYKNCKELDDDNDSVMTIMIWSAQWDATCEWLKSCNYNIEDSSTWGNYANNTAEGAGEYRETGYSEEWKANNIYDFAGNYWEWTQEPYRNVYRITRGGHWEFTGDRSPANSFDTTLPTNEIAVVTTTRATLIIMP